MASCDLTNEWSGPAAALIGDGPELALWALQAQSLPSYVRADAIVATYQIDERAGIELATRHRGRSDELGTAALKIIGRDRELTTRRTFVDAVLGRHE